MDDLISRKALLTELRALDPPGFEDSIAGKVAIKKIKEAPAVSMNSQWISGKKPPKEENDIMENCGDNRFDIIQKAKEDLINATNISSSQDEMAVLDSFLFRAWQMGWLNKYE